MGVSLARSLMPIKPGTERLREMAREHEFAFYDYSGRPETGYAVFVSAPVGIFCGYVLTEAKAKLMVELLNERVADFAEKVVLAKVLEIVRHIGNDELTDIEWPAWGLGRRDTRFDSGVIGMTADNIHAAIRREFGLADGREEKNENVD